MCAVANLPFAVLLPKKHASSIADGSDIPIVGLLIGVWKPDFP